MYLIFQMTFSYVLKEIFFSLFLCMCFLFVCQDLCVVLAVLKLYRAGVPQTQRSPASISRVLILKA